MSNAEQVVRRRDRETARRRERRVDIQQPEPTFQLARGGRVLITVLPAPVDLDLYAGDDFILTLVVSTSSGQPANLEGETARSQIRERATSPDVEAEFDCSIENNVIIMHLISEDSQELVPSSVWDVEVEYSTGHIRTMAAGNITVTPDVTR